MNQYEINNTEYSSPESRETKAFSYNETGLRYFSCGDDMTQGSANAAGLDLKVHWLEQPEAYRSEGTIGTGIYASIPTGWVGLVVPRSSLGLKGFRLKNTLGVIDSDYRGEIKLAYEGYTPEVGERVAQLVLVPHYVGAVERMASIDDLDTTERGEGGFGSTGA